MRLIYVVPVRPQHPSAMSRWSNGYPSWVRTSKAHFAYDLHWYCSVGGGGTRILPWRKAESPRDHETRSGKLDTNLFLSSRLYSIVLSPLERRHFPIHVRQVLLPCHYYVCVVLSSSNSIRPCGSVRNDGMSLCGDDVQSGDSSVASPSFARF